MVITPQVAVSYFAEFWDKAKPFEGYDLMCVQAAIANQALQGMRFAFVKILNEATAKKLEDTGYLISKSAQNTYHIRW